MTSTATIVLSVYLIVITAADMAVHFRNRNEQGGSRGLSTARLVFECISILAAVVGMAFRSACTAMFLVLAVSATAAFVLQIVEVKKVK